MIGSRKANATKPTRTSLAQFSKDLLSTGSQDGPDCVGIAALDVGLEGVHQKRFAADVVAAMSNLDSNEEVADSRFAAAMTEVGSISRF